MRRLMLTLEYDGADFYGWQVQAEGRTVQGVLEEAIAKACGESVRVTAASRTDSGVHAAGQVAHFDTDSPLSARRFLKALNFWLPPDVAVRDCREADGEFDARFSAASKLYRYRILRSEVRRPLKEGRTLRLWQPLDVEAMRDCAARLLGEHDFTSFASEHSEAQSNVRRVLRSELVETGDELHYMVEADGFLYNMVRIIVGTLLMVGRGKLTPAQFAAALGARQRRAAGPTAPARGLILVKVNYPNDPRTGASDR
ncbi:MAG: tRNA pseudouridine(38-40) synthase TruA [Planctomycetota bacterium]